MAFVSFVQKLVALDSPQVGDEPFQVVLVRKLEIFAFVAFAAFVVVVQHSLYRG